MWIRLVPDEKRNLKTPGAAEEFAQLAHRIYQDDRAVRGTRELLMALAYAATIADNEPGKEWETVRDILHNRSSVYKDPLEELVKEDRPRYEVPDQHLVSGGSCEAQRIRRYKPRTERAYFVDDEWRNTEKVCGDNARICVLERDPVTGQHIYHWYCSRHQEEAIRVRAQLKPMNDMAPEPVPNRGGLMPAYFDYPWLHIYRWACGQNWEPPVYGMSADGWPDPQNPPKIHRKRLRIISS